MHYLMSLKNFLTHVLQIVHVRDGIEIVFLASSIYYFLLWLRRDSQKSLTFSFYFYCICSFICYYGQLYTLSFLLFICSPALLMIFIMLHQERLQKNFIMLNRVQHNQEQLSWFDEFTSACLHALNNNKELVCIIEQHDSLSSLLYAPCIFRADFKKDIFEIVLEKQVCTPESMIWINREGKLVAINAVWHNNIDEEWITAEARLIHKWKQDAIFVTSKTDAIIFKISPLMRTFDIIMQAKVAEGIAPHQAFALLKRSLRLEKDPKPFYHQEKPLDQKRAD